MFTVRSRAGLWRNLRRTLLCVALPAGEVTFLFIADPLGKFDYCCGQRVFREKTKKKEIRGLKTLDTLEYNKCQQKVNL